ncbi:MAG: rhomboid family intramembrane serine protease [Saprospiraceae bacterium]|jgi:membrane associated rhomboid family serine protease
MERITDVVKHLLIINILMFFGTNLLGEGIRMSLALYFPTSEYFRPYQLVTHMFMHGNLSHLFFNMFALYMFGPPLEVYWGERRFLFFYLFSGLGALGLHMLVTYIELSNGSIPSMAINIPMVGASGAIFGLLAGYGMSFPNNIIQMIFPPIAMRAKYFVLIYAALELFFGLQRVMPGIAHFAHLGGALFGFLLIIYWRQFRGRY